QTKTGGYLLAKYGLEINAPAGVRKYTYSLDNPQADFHAANIRIRNGYYLFDVQTPDKLLKDVQLGIPGLVNVENSIAAMAASLLAGADAGKTARALSLFAGVQRRMDYRVKTNKTVYIDDYGHHPEELRFTIDSVRMMYPGRRITGIFQPHLYTRTRDFADGFAKSLSMLDELILLDIYPAREEPVPGVTSQIIFDKVTIPDKQICHKADVIGILSAHRPDVLLTMGAGDIDTLVSPIETLLKQS
ncbi:MAG: UDP-N-acetylmuramate--L-alanine ligase, partial [Bacteroidales bacterium]|nr:UDP-N-acetylmuramate--L-alanine ligase [Bacteroidales bacterium]